MARLLRTRRSRRRCGYTQRWQVETVNSMIKRNLGSALRARSNRRREMEMILRGITHNLMLLRRQNRVGTEQECPPYFPEVMQLHSKIDRMEQMLGKPEGSATPPRE
jgi:hypothetical protein